MINLRILQIVNALQSLFQPCFLYFLSYHLGASVVFSKQLKSY